MSRGTALPRSAFAARGYAAFRQACAHAASGTTLTSLEGGCLNDAPCR